MMNEGRIIYDVRGEEKRTLQVSDLLKKFETMDAEGAVNDRILLGLKVE
jgi:putative ABC transport system ATP-binding protein